jgi:hypothetical protein
MMPPLPGRCTPILAFKFQYQARVDALACPGVATRNEREDPDRKNRVDKPAKRRRQSKRGPHGRADLIRRLNVVAIVETW